MDPDELSEVIRTHLPAYLSEKEYKKVTAEIQRFSEFRDYYISAAPTDKALQGDCWTGFPITDGAELTRVHGVILSNSCDIDPDNPSRPNKNVVFTPLVPLAMVRERFSQGQLGAEKIRQNIDLIKKQLISDIFYLPAGQPSAEDHIVFLDDIYTTPVREFERQERKRVFCLGQTAFYIFLIKLSIHFTRLREHVRRFT